MPNPKPATVFQWCTKPLDPSAALLQPSDALVSNGYSLNSKPSFNNTNWIYANIGEWLAYLATLDQSFTWQNNGLFSADPTIFGPAGTAADGSDARVQAAAAYSGFALYYSPLGPMPAGAAWNAFYNDAGSTFLPYKAGTPAFRSFLDLATGTLRYLASTGVAATNTPLSWTDAMALARDGKVLVGKTTDDGSKALLQSAGAMSGQGFYALPVQSLDFNGFYWNSFLSPGVGSPAYYSNAPAFAFVWNPGIVWNGSSFLSGLVLNMGSGAAAGTALSGQSSPAVAFTPDGRLFMGNLTNGLFTDDGSGAKVQIFGGLAAHGDVSGNRVLAGTADDKTGATVQATAISEAGQLLTNRYLGISAQAADSAKLGGQPASSYMPQSAASSFAPATASQQKWFAGGGLSSGQSGNTLSENLWAPVAGTYLVNWTVYLSSPNGAMSVSTYLMTMPANTSNYNQLSNKALVAATASLFNTVVSGSFIVALGKNDLIYVAGDNTGGETIDITGSYISAIRIA